MNRREFLKAAAVAAVVPALPDTVAVAPQLGWYAVTGYGVVNPLWGGEIGRYDGVSFVDSYY